MPDIPPEIQSTLHDDDLAVIRANKIPLGGNTERDVIELVVAWAKNVAKIDSDRALPASDRGVWTEHDFVGTLFLRDHVQRALDQLSPNVREKIENYVAGTDDKFRSFTMEDSGQRTARIAEIDITGRPWWWFRVPISGPIALDLSRYIRQ